MRTVSVNVLMSGQFLVASLPCCITFVAVCICFVLGVLNFAVRPMIRVTMVTVYGQTHRMVTLCNSSIDIEL